MSKYFDERYLVNYDSYDDLNLYEVGCQKCPSQYSFGPIIRDNYVLHYIVDGCGILQLDGREHSVFAGQAFITPPNLVTFYQADRETPWEYIWIHFNGKKTRELLQEVGIAPETPVYAPISSTQELYNYMLDMLRHSEEEYRCIGDLYQMFQVMIHLSPNRTIPEKLDQTDAYIRAALNFIERKYTDPVRIQDVADFCGLDRSYLSKLFKHATNYSLQEYLIYFRIHKAKQLLQNSNLPIQHVAYAVGYPDPFAFSKVFKKETGVSPTYYRQKHLVIPK